MAEAHVAIAWLRARWDLFWYRPTSPSNLGICRILFYATFFLLYGFRDFTLWADVDRMFWMPIALFRILGLEPGGHATLLWLAIAWRVAMLCSLAGLFTRWSTLVAFLLAVYLLGLPHNFGKVHHSDALGLMIFAVLALSRCGDAWSIDALLRRRRAIEPPRDGGEYRWPVQLVRVLMLLSFFAAGLSKLRVSGLEWALSENLRYTIIWHYYNFHPPVDWGLRIAQHAAITVPLGLASLALELGAPLALFGRRLRALLIPSLYSMQLGFWLLMGISFPPYLFCFYLFWVPWPALLGRLGAARPQRRLAAG